MRGRATIVWVVMVMALVWAVPVWGQSSLEDYRQAEAMLSAWQLDEAREAIDRLSEKEPGLAEIDYLEARYAFYDGDYERALERIDKALEAREVGSWQALREIIAETIAVTEPYVRHVSPSGRFEVFIEPGRDEVLLPYAFEALDAAYEELGEELGYYPSTPIRVEVYPRTATLAQVSMLTDEEIRTSGTIALCQYNRLMITSPRAVLRGYGWVDTLIHEYVHYVINRKTYNQVPIWMHEGLAKFLERRWRGEDEAQLSASSEHLLHTRLKADDLISFEAMHPSMAKLPSQEDAAVAFAEVYTTMEYLRAQVGPGAFGQLLDTINEGYGAQEAFARVLGTSWARFEKDWRAYLHTRPVVEFEDEAEPFEERLVFEDERHSGGELDQVEAPGAQDHIKLGQMFQVRERFGAAVVQYEKATRLIGQRNPVLQGRLAQSLIATGEPQAAVEALSEVRELYPGYVTTWLELGNAYLALGEYALAREALEEAARINPFDPGVHQGLGRAYSGLGDGAQAERARGAERLLQ
ncbi:tetratricopeptide repeat protein [Bradymonadales bacterium TMQ1]|nr:tetratricopeptide repeat protein [Bradymonadales bacterium TMQ1]